MTPENLLPDPLGRLNHYIGATTGRLYALRPGQTAEEFWAELAVPAIEPSPIAQSNYRAMIRRRADTVADGGDQLGALLLLRTIGE